MGAYSGASRAVRRLSGQAAEFHDGAGVELDVGVEFAARFQLGEDGLHLAFHLDGEGDAWAAEVLGDVAQHAGAGVLGAVDGVAEAHDAVAGEDAFTDPGVDAVGSADGVEGVLQALTSAYAQLISARPETLLMQVQGYAAEAATEAQGDDLIGEVVRAGWMRIRETVHLSPGADADRTTSFFACGMPGSTRAAMGLSPNAGRQGGVREGVRQCMPAASSRVVTVGAMSPVRLSAPMPARALAPSKTMLSCRASRSGSPAPPCSASVRKKAVRFSLT